MLIITLMLIWAVTMCCWSFFQLIIEEHKNKIESAYKAGYDEGWDDRDYDFEKTTDSSWVQYKNTLRRGK
jgi:hypothetical protein